MRDGKRSVPQAGGSRGMDVRTEARCDEEARTYPASEFSYTGFSSAGGVLFPKLSKLLNQGDALSAPCFSLAPSRGAPRPAGTGGMPRTGLTRHFRCHITVCYTQLITPKSADELPVVGGRCTGGARRCKARQGRRGMTAPIYVNTYSHSSTV